MEIKELNNDGLTIRVSFHFAKEDYSEERKKVLNRFRRNADIKGFRKGMAPASLIEKIHGGEALVEAINILISENLNKYIEENKLTIIGEPLPVEDENKNTLYVALVPYFQLLGKQYINRSLCPFLRLGTCLKGKSEINCGSTPSPKAPR